MLVQHGKNDIEYCIELLDEPTKPYLQGELHLKSKWYRHTRNDAPTFDKEWSETKTIKEINRRLNEAFTIRDLNSMPYYIISKKEQNQKERN